MTNTEAVAIWKNFLETKAPMIIKPTPADFDCEQPFVVVAHVRPAFVMGDFATIEAAECFCHLNNLPIRGIEQVEFKMYLQTSEHGFHDYDVKGHPTLRRVCVPVGLCKGDHFNVYFGESSKSGAKWLGTLEKSLRAWTDEQIARDAGTINKGVPACAHHGQMEPRSAGTPEQAYAGSWYQCTRCTNSALLPTEAVNHQLAQNA